jgi:hypothetical protein
MTLWWFIIIVLVVAGFLIDWDAKTDRWKGAIAAVGISFVLVPFAAFILYLTLWPS